VRRELSPAEIRCPHAPSCVPCPLRGLPYREQLARKRRSLEAAIAKYRSLSGVVVEDVVGSRDLFGYRNAAKLAVRSRRDGSLVAGVYQPASHRLAEASRCSVHHPALNEVIAATLAEASALGIEAFDERRGDGELRYIVARYSALLRRVLLVLVTAGPPSAQLRDLARRLGRRCRSLGGVVHNRNAAPGNVILGPRYSTLRSPAELVDRVGFLKLRVSPASFLQANLWTARRIYETALEWAQPAAGDSAIDLFCGVGPLTFHLATRAARVIGIEEAPSAVGDARSNQRRNGFHNARFEEGPADEVLPRLRQQLSGVDVVTLNPTRKGVSSRVLEDIAALSPARVVYVSCDAETLARDLDRLAELAYRTLRARPFDMLPQTDHVEVVAVAERAGSRC